MMRLPVIELFRFLRILALIGFSITAACRPLVSSKLTDIYQADRSSQTTGNARRHNASSEEILWTVHSRGCTAILLNPQYAITANHCETAVGDPMRSGYSLQTQGKDDLEILSIRESSVELDYKILQVRWLTAIPKQLKYPPRIATSAEDIFVSAEANQGDEIFTVGFPDDRDNVWKATYAEGQAKAVKDHRLHFNIGIINGSSGGGVLKKESLMLVSLANGGRKNLGEAGWDNADAEDALTWNYGTSLWQIYAVSPLLKILFPAGINLASLDSFQPKTQIYLAISGAGTSAKLAIAASWQAEEILVCAGFVKDCQKNKAGVEILKIQKSAQGRAFFSSAQSPETLKALTLAAFDTYGSLIGKRQVLLEKGG